MRDKRTGRPVDPALVPIHLRENIGPEDIYAILEDIRDWVRLPFTGEDASAKTQPITVNAKAGLTLSDQDRTVDIELNAPVRFVAIFATDRAVDIAAGPGMLYPIATVPAGAQAIVQLPQVETISLKYAAATNAGQIIGSASNHPISWEWQDTGRGNAPLVQVMTALSIAAAATDFTSTFRMDGYQLLGLLRTGDQAFASQLQVSPDNGTTWYNVVSGGNFPSSVSFTGAANSAAMQVVSCLPGLLYRMSVTNNGAVPGTFNAWIARWGG